MGTTETRTAGGDAIKNVLVIDDNRAFMELLGIALEREGIRASLAPGGAEGLSLLEEDNVLPDIVLLDIQMPELDGYEVLRRIRESPRPELRTLPVIGMSGVVIADGADFDHRLAKPFSLSSLLPVMREVRARRADGKRD